MRTLIFAGGKATRFNYTIKALLSLREETIISRLIRQLKSLDIKPIYVVTGYKAKEFLKIPDIVVINNQLYNSGDNAQGMKLALDRIGFEDTLTLDADIILSDDLLPKLVSSYRGKSLTLVDLRTTDPEAMKLVIVNGRIVKFSKDEGVGAEICEIVDKEKLKKIYKDLDHIRWWGIGPNAKGFFTVEVNKDSKWMDVDTLEEYEQAKLIFNEDTAHS